ncbi:hypothetical protein ES332_D07G048900v1 [Gossypium tomentosum]|uniref:Aminotransferase class I/classII large domain-containing protein n=1 Tax=Gossypium tomentosum TaxID=34277 RepID=A0A5D2K340_GOSTO|nr:hypothetical protein ES332_D07G048900v1 [Gossypium tomentosum]
MRLVVPLQGVAQGRGGLLLGSLIPCALFYFLQLYLKRRRSPSDPSPPSSSSSNQPGMTRHSSLSNLLSRGPLRISSLATSIAKPDDSPYYMGLDRASGDPYHRIANPDGVIQLGLSENRLCFDLIEKWTSENLRDWVMGREGGDLSISGIATYQPSDGTMKLKMAMAGFMSRVIGRDVSYEPSQMVLTAGVTPAIETLCFCLADHGNAFLVPTPYYPSFDRDMKWRTGVELIPVHCRSKDNFVLSISALDQAFNQTRKRETKIRGILLSNPANPVGNLLSRKMLEALLKFAEEKNIHIVSDEIFAGSIYGEKEFVSIAEIVGSEDFDKNRVHIVYGLSKDLFLPGVRVGMIYSFNENVLAAARKLTRFSSVSAPTQRLLVSMLSDTRFIVEYIQTNKKRIRDMRDLFVAGLEELGIKCTDSRSSLYCWADMRNLIPTYGEKGELELWEKLLNVGKINLTPGSACHCIEPGWFRCCFTTLDKDDVRVVMGRIRKVVGSHTSCG